MSHLFHFLLAQNGLAAPVPKQTKLTLEEVEKNKDGVFDPIKPDPKQDASRYNLNTKALDDFNRDHNDIDPKYLKDTKVFAIKRGNDVVGVVSTGNTGSPPRFVVGSGVALTRTEKDTWQVEGVKGDNIVVFDKTKFTSVDIDGPTSGEPVSVNLQQAVPNAKTLSIGFSGQVKADVGKESAPYSLLSDIKYDLDLKVHAPLPLLKSAELTGQAYKAFAKESFNGSIFVDMGDVGIHPDVNREVNRRPAGLNSHKVTLVAGADEVSIIDNVAVAKTAGEAAKKNGTDLMDEQANALNDHQAKANAGIQKLRKKAEELNMEKPLKAPPPVPATQKKDGLER